MWKINMEEFEEGIGNRGTNSKELTKVYVSYGEAER